MILLIRMDAGYAGLQEQKPAKGVIQEKDIVACRDGQVTFR